jgi:hypothetical protein
MQDHFDECFDTRLSPDEGMFSRMFCARCLQPSCERSQVNDVFAQDAQQTSQGEAR